MLVLPADAWIDPERDGVYREVLKAAAPDRGRTARSASRRRSSPSASRPQLPATEYGYLIPDYDAGEMIDGIKAYPLVGFEEKPNLERAGQLYSQLGVAWNAGHLRVAAPGDPRGDRSVHGPDHDDRHGRRQRVSGLQRGVRPPQAAVDRPARSWRARRATAGRDGARWTSAGAISDRGPSCSAAIGGTGAGRVVPPNEPVAGQRGGPRRRAPGRPARRERADRAISSPRARWRSSRAPPRRASRSRRSWPAWPIGRNASDRRGRCRYRGRHGFHAGEVADRLRHRRLARPDRRGLHVRQRPPLRRRRRPLRRRARASRRRASSSPTTGGSPPSTSRRRPRRSSSRTTSRWCSRRTPSRPR